MCVVSFRQKMRLVSTSIRIFIQTKKGGGRTSHFENAPPSRIFCITFFLLYFQKKNGNINLISFLFVKILYNLQEFFFYFSFPPFCVLFHFFMQAKKYAFLLLS